VSGTYGHIEYLWFDHHGNPTNSTSPFGPWCAHMCDPMLPTLWRAVDEVVKKHGTTLRGGADLNIGPDTMRSEFSGRPPSHEKLALSIRAPETRSRKLQTHRTWAGPARTRF
jgi:hypothetical protein